MGDRTGNISGARCVLPIDSSYQGILRAACAANKKENTMDGGLIGLAAVIMIFAFPLAGLYTYYRVRKLRTEERLAAIARGVEIPMAAELSPAARSRRSGILLVTGALGYMMTFALISFIEREPEVWTAAAFGIIPLAVGIGYFLDATLIRHDAQA
jgi:uncharacterized protein DUF6249